MHTIELFNKAIDEILKLESFSYIKVEEDFVNAASFGVSRVEDIVVINEGSEIQIGSAYDEYKLLIFSKDEAVIYNTFREVSLCLYKGDVVKCKGLVVRDCYGDYYIIKISRYSLPYSYSITPVKTSSYTNDSLTDELIKIISNLMLKHDSYLRCYETFMEYLEGTELFSNINGTSVDSGWHNVDIVGEDLILRFKGGSLLIGDKEDAIISIALGGNERVIFNVSKGVSYCFKDNKNYFKSEGLIVKDATLNYYKLIFDFKSRKVEVYTGGSFTSLTKRCSVDGVDSDRIFKELTGLQKYHIDYPRTLIKVISGLAEMSKGKMTAPYLSKGKSVDALSREEEVTFTREFFFYEVSGEKYCYNIKRGCTEEKDGTIVNGVRIGGVFGKRAVIRLIYGDLSVESIEGNQVYYRVTIDSAFDIGKFYKNITEVFSGCDAIGGGGRLAAITDGIMSNRDMAYAMVSKFSDEELDELISSFRY